MRKRLATALLLGVGFVPEVKAAPHDPLAAQRAYPRSVRPDTPLLARSTQFDHLRAAGKLRRHQLATFSLDDGRLFAEWSVGLAVPHPMRIETEELDAEWMAHVPNTAPGDRDRHYWLLARRDLQPDPTGRYWFVRLYASPADGTDLSLVATCETHRGLGADAATITYTQSADGVHARTADASHIAFDLRAQDLPSLLAAHPAEAGAYLAPALRRISGIDPT